MATDTHVELGSWNVELDPNRVMTWSTPPVLTTDPAASPDKGIILTRGIIYEVKNPATILIQNINVTDAKSKAHDIEFSFHGDKDGEWFYLHAGSFLRVTGNVFLLNRTNQQNVAVSISPISNKGFSCA